MDSLVRIARSSIRYTLFSLPTMFQRVFAIIRRARPPTTGMRTESAGIALSASLTCLRGLRQELRRELRRLGAGGGGRWPSSDGQRQERNEPEDQGDRSDEQRSGYRPIKRRQPVEEGGEKARSRRSGRTPRRRARTRPGSPPVSPRFAPSPARIVAPDRRCRFACPLTAGEEREEKPRGKRDPDRREGVLPHSGAQIVRGLGQILIASEKVASAAVEVRGRFSGSGASSSRCAPATRPLALSTGIVELPCASFADLPPRAEPDPRAAAFRASRSLSSSPRALREWPSVMRPGSRLPSALDLDRRAVPAPSVPVSARGPARRGP